MQLYKEYCVPLVVLLMVYFILWILMLINRVHDAANDTSDPVLSELMVGSYCGYGISYSLDVYK